ncbi:cell wall binding protein [Fictibacillus macauensis ZFHKF-1]|uniref:Cell wall binding protein n=1 Tax=Fictibacillus macauensis ZFHKF-1 TaxID=1196324 RepID=I8AKG6_9BACL|nr:3D domain-containing protein [Fictibacillus macauensis]EIT86049.1 cell wall binding protein [Fictibacillus macauensis ZFHKF-1]
MKKLIVALVVFLQVFTLMVSNPAEARSTYKKRMTGFQVTHYNESGLTASGRRTKDGVTIAVDPRVIKLGTWVEIKFPNGKKIKRRADDTGGAIKGRIIDLYVNKSDRTVRKLGRIHNVTVTILK